MPGAFVSQQSKLGVPAEPRSSRQEVELRLNPLMSSFELGSRWTSSSTSEADLGKANSGASSFTTGDNSQS